MQPQSGCSERTRQRFVRCVCIVAALLLCEALCAKAFFDFSGGGGGRARAPPTRPNQPDVDYYEVLQLEGKREAATEKDIRQQFRRLSRVYHPDVAKTEADKAKYSEVNRAYEVLSDKRKRKVYDMRGERGLEQLEQLDRSRGTGGGNRVLHPLERLFGATADDGLRGPQKEMEVTVDLSKVYTGAKESLTVQKNKVCHHCKGSGADPAAGMVNCRQCGGQGMLRQRVQFAPGMVQEIHQQCPACGGAGRHPERACPVCHGKKIMRGVDTLTMELEPGMTENHIITFEMEGEEVPDRLPGDLVVHVRTKPHPVFSRRRNQLDLDTSLTLTLRETLAGFDRNITHLDGVEKVRVTHQGGVLPYGSVLRLPGKGMPKLHVPSERGDLYVRLQYELPAQLTTQQKNLVDRLL